MVTVKSMMAVLALTCGENDRPFSVDMSDSTMLAHLGSVGRIGQFGGDVHPKTFHHVHLLVADFHLSNASDVTH